MLFFQCEILVLVLFEGERLEQRMILVLEKPLHGVFFGIQRVIPPPLSYCRVLIIILLKILQELLPNGGLLSILPNHLRIRNKSQGIQKVEHGIIVGKVLVVLDYKIPEY